MGKSQKDFRATTFERYQKIIAIGVVPENLTTFNSSAMM